MTDQTPALTSRCSTSTRTHVDRAAAICSNCAGPTTDTPGCVGQIRNGFPWPGSGLLRQAADALADERARRDHQARRWAQDLGVEARPPAAMNDKETVLVVLWTLRGQRTVPEPAFPDPVEIDVGEHRVRVTADPNFVHVATTWPPGVPGGGVWDGRMYTPAQADVFAAALRNAAAEVTSGRPRQRAGVPHHASKRP